MLRAANCIWTPFECLLLTSSTCRTPPLIGFLTGLGGSGMWNFPVWLIVVPHVNIGLTFTPLRASPLAGQPGTTSYLGNLREVRGMPRA